MVLYAQDTFRELLHNVSLFDDYLAPKIDQIMASDGSDLAKIDKIYWLRHRHPIIVGSKVPFIRDGRVGGFCWGWQLDRREGLPGPSPSRLQSDSFINELMGLSAIFR